MSNRNSSKGNPASHRMSNAHIKDRRARCWRTGEKRRQAHAAAQHEREIANRALRKEGLPTPWEQACAARAQRREGLHAVWLASLKPEQLPAS